MDQRIRSLFKERPALLAHQLGFMLAGRPNPIRPWETDDRFNDIISRVRERTLVSRSRCFMLYQFALATASLPGDVAEVGVFKGGTARLLAEATGKPVHLFDTFAGMPKTDAERDLVRAGDFADTSIEGVKAYLAGCPNVHFYPGFFPQTAGPLEAVSFSLAHIDVDMHRSVVDACAFFHPRMAKGGIMIFDDYGQLTCPGAKLGVDEFFADKPEKPVYLPTGQCFVMKPS